MSSGSTGSSGKFQPKGQERIYEPPPSNALIVHQKIMAAEEAERAAAKRAASAQGAETRNLQPQKGEPKSRNKSKRETKMDSKEASRKRVSQENDRSGEITSLKYAGEMCPALRSWAATKEPVEANRSV
ncbi:uncharacterized protein Z518_10504 [Rhinocladiella mackenziei CBS 650.93]|uniref:Uncharacterized protein n=1 Tax=Rhinocladiella mackenziei CBS 650.93 TaxID=1442369 RepID=A0A0D2IUG4_9EURO|nr:uncharacterized protein Z518_10504 [Rhinocladiella mackenziei CBS 650.93]KIX00365.1 hypothetical protein Z518_10504 [Rhinocladiella mackenziei CBS 650.93]